MADTYTQLYAQIIFSPKGRQNLIQDRIKTQIHKYITGIVKNQNQKLMIINGMPDHIHMFVGFLPDIALSDLISVIKSNTTNYINDQKLVVGKFSWQRGFGAFTYSKSQVQGSLVIFKTRNNITGRKHLGKNIWKYWKSLV